MAAGGLKGDQEDQEEDQEEDRIRDNQKNCFKVLVCEAQDDFTARDSVLNSQRRSRRDRKGPGESWRDWSLFQREDLDGLADSERADGWTE